MPRHSSWREYVELDRSMNLEDLHDGDEDLDFSTNTLHVFQDDMDKSESRDIPELLVPLTTNSKDPRLLIPATSTLLDESDEGGNDSPRPLKSSTTRSSSLNKSLQIATLLYESLSELARTNADDDSLAAADPLACHPPRAGVKGNAQCPTNLSILKASSNHMLRKDHLVGLLSDGLRDLEELENRHSRPNNDSNAAAAATAASYKHKMFEKQKLQLMDMLSKALSEIEQLEAATAPNAGACSTQRVLAKKEVTTAAAPARNSRRSKRRPSLGSDVSSITSRASSFYPDKPLDQVNKFYQLPKCLTPQTSASSSSSSSSSSNLANANKLDRIPRNHSSSSNKKPQTKLECDIDSALQDSFTSFCTLDPEDAPPKRPQRRGSFGMAGGSGESDLPKSAAVEATSDSQAIGGCDSAPSPAAGAPRTGVRRHDSPPLSPRRRRSSTSLASSVGSTTTHRTDTMHSDICSLLEPSGPARTTTTATNPALSAAPTCLLA